LPDGRVTHLPLLPIELTTRELTTAAGSEPTHRTLRPTQGGALATPGEHTVEILASLGVSAAETSALQATQII
jgi:crotonobetainyl-CoA:carnitine CoA-transferase CaiB-like acyl-CoA transferase